MILFRRVTPRPLSAWVVAQPVTGSHRQHGLRVWREENTNFATLRNQLIEYRLDAYFRHTHFARPLARRGKAAKGGHIRADQRLFEIADEKLASGIELSLTTRNRTGHLTRSGGFTSDGFGDVAMTRIRLSAGPT